MLTQLIKHYDNGNKTRFSRRLGMTPQGISTWLSRGTIDYELVYSKCEMISADWLLSGEGSMLRNDQEDLSPPKHTKGNFNTEPLSGEASAYYKMYKEKDAKVEELLKENARLEARIQQLESKGKNSAEELGEDKITEAFTSESSGDYGEDSIPTKLPSGSKRSSVGKT